MQIDGMKPFRAAIWFRSKLEMPGFACQLFMSPGKRSGNVISSEILPVGMLGAPTLQSRFGPLRLSPFHETEKDLGGHRYQSDCDVYTAVKQRCAKLDTHFWEEGIGKLVYRWDKCLNRLGG